MAFLATCAIGLSAACSGDTTAGAPPTPAPSTSSSTPSPSAKPAAVPADQLTPVLDRLKPGLCVNFGFDGYTRNPKNPRLVGCSSPAANQRFTRRVLERTKKCDGRHESQWVGSDPKWLICLDPIFRVGDCMPSKNKGNTALTGLDVPCDKSIHPDGDSKVRIVRVIKNADKDRYYCSRGQAQFDVPEQRIALCTKLLQLTGG